MKVITKIKAIKKSKNKKKTVQGQPKVAKEKLSFHNKLVLMAFHYSNQSVNITY